MDGWTDETSGGQQTACRFEICHTGMGSEDMSTSIADSVRKELVYIGMTKDLRSRIEGRIRHAREKCPPGQCHRNRGDCELSNVEKEVLAQGRQLEVSWAKLASPDSAERHKAELLRKYESTPRNLPGIVGRKKVLPGIVDRKGEWVPGSQRRSTKTGPVSDLDWQGWHIMALSTVKCIPKKPGVLRVRAK